MFPDSSRQIERQLVSVDNIVIGGLQTLTITPRGPPSELQLIRDVKLDDQCITLAAAGEDMYLGTYEGQILKIDKQGQVQVFADIVGYIVGLFIHIHTLLRNKNIMVCFTEEKCRNLIMRASTPAVKCEIITHSLPIYFALLYITSPEPTKIHLAF